MRVFSPSRDTAYEYDDRKCKLNDFHAVIVKPDGLLCYYISGYGPGHFLEKKLFWAVGNHAAETIKMTI